jgi:hypothetical protein
LASVPSSAGPQRGNTITPINPYTGELGTSVFVASEPNNLALADDGSRVYVASNSTNFVTPFSLSTMTPGTPFQIGTANQRVDDMEVSPGYAAGLVVARKNVGLSPRGAGVAVYVNGVRLPNQSIAHSNVIEFGETSNVLHGNVTELSSLLLRAYSVDLTDTGGITEVYTKEGIVTQNPQDLEFDAGRLYFTNGQVIEAATSALMGSFAASGPVEPVSAAGRTYFVENDGKKLKAFSQTTFVPLGEMAMPQMTSGARRLISLGNSALAFNTVSTPQLFIIRLNGDYDANGEVTAADYEVWKANYGSTTSLSADGNRDNIVDAADYIIWRDNLGQSLVGSTTLGSTAAQSVPEQYGLLSILVSLSAFLPRRWSSTKHQIQQPRRTEKR